MFDNFKNCITSNLISLFGYLIFIASVIFIFGVLPIYNSMEVDHRYVFTESEIAFYTYLLVILAIYFFLFLLFIGYFIESYFKDLGKIKTLKFLETFNKRKTILFWLGYFFVFTPIYYLAVIFIYYFVFVLFMG